MARKNADQDAMPTFERPYDPDASHVPYFGNEVHGAKWAQPSPVLVGSHVLYRHVNHGDVTEAIVLEVVHDAPEWYIDESGLKVKLPPWPTLTLDTLYGPARTREARVRGSAGWLPLTWIGTPGW